MVFSKSRFFISTALLLSIFACKNDKSGESVQEIRNSTADIVRNPISADQPMDTTMLPKLTFEETEFQFGEVDPGTVVEHDFKFKNTGRVSLIISDCRTSCGCTASEWPKEPVPPGGESKIHVKFDTEGKSNRQTKIVFVTANTYPNETMIYLKGFVREAAGAKKAH